MNLLRVSFVASIAAGVLGVLMLVAAPLRASQESSLAHTPPSAIRVANVVSGGQDADRLLEALFSEATEPTKFFVDGFQKTTPSLPEEGGDGDDAIDVNCGEAKGVATPANGISGSGWGATEGDAIVAAAIDCLSKIGAYVGPINCPECPVPGCLPYVSLITEMFSVETFQMDGQWFAIVTYKGPILAGCSPCEF